MATATSDGQLSKVATFFQPAMNALLFAVVIGLFVVRDTANAAYSNTQQHERRIEMLENTPVRISILETRVGTLIDQNILLQQKIDRLSDQLTQHMSASHQPVRQPQ